MKSIFYLCATTFDTNGNATSRLLNKSDLGQCQQFYADGTPVDSKPVAFAYDWATFEARRMAHNRRLKGAYLSVVTLQGMRVYCAR